MSWSYFGKLPVCESFGSRSYFLLDYFQKSFFMFLNIFSALQPSAEENGSKDERADGKKSSEDYDQLKSDYEDLLVLLEDQDAKIQQYKV